MIKPPLTKKELDELRARQKELQKRLRDLIASDPNLIERALKGGISQELKKVIFSLMAVGSALDRDKGKHYVDGAARLRLEIARATGIFSVLKEQPEEVSNEDANNIKLEA